MPPSSPHNPMASPHVQVTGLPHPDDSALWPVVSAPAPLARGRHARDALAKVVPHTVTSTSHFQSSLQDYLSSPPEDPEHTEAHFSFWIGTTFTVPPPASTTSTTSESQAQAQTQQASESTPHQHAHAPPGYQPAHYGGSVQYQHLADAAGALAPAFSESIEPNNGAGPGSKDEHKVSSTVYDALQPTSDPKEKMRKQRAIAKCCVDMIQRIDGYRYSFHNCWNSREDDSFRFSYYCNDSLLNKDRAANGKGAKLGKRATKPVYDCKGVLSIKFSAAKQTLDVIYKHVPIHKTYEERAPPPRKDSKRRKYLEENDPEALVRLASRSRQLSSEDPDTPRPKRKKSQPPSLPLPVPEPPRQSNTSLESDLRAQSLRSLLELIQCDGTRPICQKCLEKNRSCVYPDPSNGDDQHQRTEFSDSIRQADQAGNDEVSELEQLKRELEEARAKIREFETGERASTTPVQTPQQAYMQRQPQRIGSPQPSLSTQQQLQAAAAQQMQSTQLQKQQNYFTTNHANHSPYRTMSRSMPQNNHSVNTMTGQNTLMTQSPISTQNAQVPQTQQAQSTSQIHQASSGMSPTAPSMDASDPSMGYSTWVKRI
ncbi:ATPase (AAA+ superfamily) [Pyrenophora tritici-repentis]|nr:ATPase (AAA+ superfamily) [Pyrenophora tritici-repentis]